MNTRIKELIVLSTTCKQHTGPFGIQQVTEKFDKEKFAKLIVKECAQLIQQQVSLKYKDGWEQHGVTDEWAFGHYNASLQSRALIKQYFGVEE